MRADQAVLMATSSVEEHSYGPVCEKLAKAGAPFVVFATDRVLEGVESFGLTINDAGTVAASYALQDISPGTVGSAWYWKPASFRVRGAETNVSKQMTMVNEVTALHNAIWSLYPDELWLSSPANLWRGERKLAQLAMARSVGFSIPSTAVGNEWDFLRDAVVRDGDDFIVKMARGVLADQNVVKGMQTTRVDEATYAALRAQTIPFPGIYQPFVPKAREWRVTVVGDDVFPAAIYTDESAKDDWRQHQLTAAVRFAREAPPTGLPERCVSFLHGVGLGYGAFDLIEKPDGEVVFLECNPSGQFSWLEKTLELPISDALAAALLRRRSSP